jgi:hypothetical protein
VNLNKSFHPKELVKFIFVYLVFSFIFFTAIFTRSFIGLSLSGYRLGEMYVGFSLLLSIYFLIYPKPNNFFNFGSSRFSLIHRTIILYIIIRLFLNYENLNLYQIKSSSFIWTISFIYLGVIVSHFHNQNVIFLFGFSILPIVIYIFQTGNFPNIFIDLFTKYSDKFQFMKAADMILIVIVCSIYVKQSQKNQYLSIIYFNFLCFLFLPLAAVNSRGAVLGLLLFLIIENLNNIKYIKNNKSILLILLVINLFIFSFSSLRVNNLGSDYISSEEPDLTITDVSSAVSQIANQKNTQDVFLTFYIQDGRLFSSDPTTNWRLDIWQDVVQDLTTKNRLFHGYGYGEIIPVMTDPSAPGRLGRDGLNEHVHNYFVTTLARGGLINLSLFILLHLEIFKYLKSRKIGKTVYSFLIPCIFMSCLDITMDGVQFPLIYYFFIGYFSLEKH